MRSIGSGAQQSKTSVKSVGVNLRSDSPNATESAGRCERKALLIELDGTLVDTTLAVESTWRWAADNLTCHSHN